MLSLVRAVKRRSGESESECRFDEYIYASQSLHSQQAQHLLPSGIFQIRAPRVILAHYLIEPDWPQL